MQRKTLLITLLIVILTGGLAATGLYMGKQFTEPKRRGQETTPEHPVGLQETVSEITPAAIDICDWKTYTNEKYGYEIKYPKDWIYEEDIAPP